MTSAQTIQELLNDSGVEIAPGGHNHSRSGWVQIDCPWCGPESKRYHLGFNIRGNFFNCWKCGHHFLMETLVELTHLEPRDLSGFVRELKRNSLFLDDYEAKPRTGLKLPSPLTELSRPHTRYLLARGFDPRQIQDVWGVKGVGPVPMHLAWRLFIPFYYREEMVSWTTRSLQSDGLRYKSASPDEEAVNHRELLYAEDFCRHNAIIIHEGPTDVWRTGPGAVAILGMKPTKAQVGKMSKYPVRVVCFDNTKDAQHQAQILCDDLMAFPGDTFRVKLETGKDVAEADEKEVQVLRRYLI